LKDGAHFGSSHQLPNGEVLRGFDITDPDGYERQRERWCGSRETASRSSRTPNCPFLRAEKPTRNGAEYPDRAVFYHPADDEFSSFYGLRGSLPYMGVRPEPFTS